MKASKYTLRPAEEINPAIAQLPQGELIALRSAYSGADDELLADFKGVKVTDSVGKSEYVQVCGKDYKLVQHSDAFRPIIEGLTVAGNNSFQFNLTNTMKHAQLRIFTGGAAYDGVSVGWKVFNSFTGHHTISYGLEIDRATSTLEVVGYRQVCSNGMKIRVPLEDATIIKVEEVTKIKNLLADFKAYKHTGAVLERIEGMKYIAEAVEVLKTPILRMITRAEDLQVSAEMAKSLIQRYAGKRYAAKILVEMETEQPTVWGLVNAFTYVASHDESITDSGRELLEDKAAELLLAEVRGR